MSRKNKYPIIENVEIIDVGAEGKAIGKALDRENNIIVFVPYVIPGDIVDVQITKKKRNYLEGRAINFRNRSPYRLKPFCSHYGICGGCKWQILPYEKQTFYKQQQIYENLSRIGKIELPEMQPIIGSEKTKYYRNKLEYTFSNRRYLTFEEMDSSEEKEMNALGFHVPRLFDKVIDIEKCYLQDEPSNEIRLAIKGYALEHKLSFFDIRNHNGLLRNLIIRTSSTGEVMVIVAFYENQPENIKALLQFIEKQFPVIISLMYVINQKANDTIADQEIILFAGRDHIFEKMEGLKFKIGPKSFYQTNSEQAYTLYKITRNFAELTGNEIVYDLYTGTGTIANFIAKDAKFVIGLEYIEEAVRDAKINSELNSINNTEFFAGDIKDILNQDFINTKGRPDVIITDPPRAGMHQNVIDSILYAQPHKIVYVSCNSATQARDINLMDNYYKVIKIQAVDMFPHTHHVENVVLLERR